MNRTVLRTGHGIFVSRYFIRTLSSWYYDFVLKP
jgi:hypothetical protein